MVNRRHITWSFLAVASLTGCKVAPATHTAPGTPTSGSERAWVTGHVVDVEGAPVAGAAVVVRTSGEHASADSNGEFTLDIPANITLTLSATAPSMAPTLLQQFLVSPGTSATVELRMVTTEHFNSLVAMGADPSGGVVAVAFKSMSGTGSVDGATVTMTPSLGRVTYAPTGPRMAEPDPEMKAVMSWVMQSDESYAWVVGVQPHVSSMQLALHGVSQVEAPYAIDDAIFTGSFTVEAGALTLVTLFTK